MFFFTKESYVSPCQCRTWVIYFEFPYQDHHHNTLAESFLSNSWLHVSKYCPWHYQSELLNKVVRPIQLGKMFQYQFIFCQNFLMMKTEKFRQAVTTLLTNDKHIIKYWLKTYMHVIVTTACNARMQLSTHFLHESRFLIIFKIEIICVLVWIWNEWD